LNPTPTAGTFDFAVQPSAVAAEATSRSLVRFDLPTGIVSADLDGRPPLEIVVISSGATYVIYDR
jgi:hypothetical protein